MRRPEDINTHVFWPFKSQMFRVITCYVEELMHHSPQFRLAHILYHSWTFWIIKLLQSNFFSITQWVIIILLKLEVFHRLTSPFLSVIKDKQVPNCWCWYLWHAFRDNRQTQLAPAQDLSLGILGSFSSPWRRGGGKGIPTSCQRATQAARARSLELILTPIHRKQPRRVTTCSLRHRYKLFFSLIQSSRELFRHNQNIISVFLETSLTNPKGLWTQGFYATQHTWYVDLQRY